MTDLVKIKEVFQKTALRNAVPCVAESYSIELPLSDEPQEKEAETLTGWPFPFSLEDQND